MKHKFRKGLAVCVICLLVLVTIPIAQADTDHYSDSVVLIVGKCNTVSTTGLWADFNFHISDNQLSDILRFFLLKYDIPISFRF